MFYHNHRPMVFENLRLEQKKHLLNVIITLCAQGYNVTQYAENASDQNNYFYYSKKTNFLVLSKDPDSLYLQNLASKYLFESISFPYYFGQGLSGYIKNSPYRIKGFTGRIILFLSIIIGRIIRAIGYLPHLISQFFCRKNLKKIPINKNLEQDNDYLALMTSLDSPEKFEIYIKSLSKDSRIIPFAKACQFIIFDLLNDSEKYMWEKRLKALL